MAVKKFNKDQLSRGKSILNPDDNFNPDDFTYDVITEFEKNPIKENLPEVIEVIKKDSSLPAVQKEILINRLKEDFVTLFGFNNIPEDYKSLKNESKFLSDITQYSFASLAVRLKKIRDKELYREDNYPDFKSFIDNELSINRTTAYNYIDLVTIFGVQTFEHVTEPSKLIPALPLLKSAQSNKDIPVSRIKKDIIKQAQSMSARELNAHIKDLKVEYGFSKPVSEKTVNKTSDDNSSSPADGKKNPYPSYFKGSPSEVAVSHLTTFKKVYDKEKKTDSEPYFRGYIAGAVGLAEALYENGHISKEDLEKIKKYKV